MELLLSGGVVINDMTVAGKQVFIGYKTFETYRSAGMDLGRAYSHFRTEAVPEAVSKSC